MPSNKDIFRKTLGVFIQKERDKWDRYYASYQLQTEDPTIREFNDAFAAHIASILPDGSRVLEAGCGAGSQSLALARLIRFDIHLMDFSAEALQCAQEAFKQAGQSATFHLGDVFAAGYAEYDLVFNAGSLEHYTFDEQVAFLRGMASRSRRFVLALVPNNRCYWYWLWRIRAASQGHWPYGKEIPVSDLSMPFQAAGVTFIGGAFLGETWSEGFINSVLDSVPDLRGEILTIHRSPAIPIENRAHLYAAIGAVDPTVRLPDDSPFSVFGSSSCPGVPDQQAVMADLLALQISLQAQVRKLSTELDKRDAIITEKQVQIDRLHSEVAELPKVRELERQLETIYHSKGWALLSRLYRSRSILFPAGSVRERFGRWGMHQLRQTRQSSRQLSSLFRRPVRTFWSSAAAPFQAKKLSREFLPYLKDRTGVIVLQVGAFDRGGLEEVVLTLARNLGKSSSFRPVVFVAGKVSGHLGAVAEQHGIPVIPLNENAFLLRRLIRLLQVKLVNLHYTTFGVQEYERAGVPIVYTIHNTYVWADSAFVRERTEQYHYVSRFIAVSEPVAEYFASKFRIDPARITMIPNGLDIDHVAEEEQMTRASLGLNDDDIVFLNISSFNWNKFHMLIVAAMERLVQRLPNAKALFVGNTHDISCRALIEEEIAKRHIEGYIKIMKYVPKSRVMGLMRLADCFILPSLVEGWSIAAMEAMYCGLPLILSDVGSARALINNNDIGIIIRNPFPDIQELTPEIIMTHYANGSHLDNLDDMLAAMERIGQNKDEWKKRAKAGREKIVNHFTAEHMCRGYVSCFKSVISHE